MDRVALDILGPFPISNAGNKYVLVVQDQFTKWTEAYALPDQTAQTVAEVFVKEFVSRFGACLLRLSFKMWFTDSGECFAVLNKKGTLVMPNTKSIRHA